MLDGLPVKTVAGLKGRTVAFARGSSSNYMIVAALDKVGLSDADIKPAFVSPADARAAFVGGKVGAWVIRDPYLAPAGLTALFDRFGITPARERVVRTSADAEQPARDLDSRVVLKLLSNRITHKSDIGGVAVGLAADEIGARLTRMRCDVEAATGFAPDTFLVQEMVSSGVEMIVGLHRDQLGTAILPGMGGVTAEILNDTVLRMLPTDALLSHRDACEMIRELRTWPLLDGYRGRPRADVDALAAALVAFSRMVLQLGERLVEAEINPLFVLDSGRGVRAADGVAVLACRGVAAASAHRARSIHAHSASAIASTGTPGPKVAATPFVFRCCASAAGKIPPNTTGIAAPCNASSSSSPSTSST
ncbi:hypothetical protein DM992_36705 [Burkholderia sp. JP2-270]|nr:hypothetical protein DM992_36705 [Burkholderia sp. JP2-270]